MTDTANELMLRRHPPPRRETYSCSVEQMLRNSADSRKLNGANCVDLCTSEFGENATSFFEKGAEKFNAYKILDKVTTGDGDGDLEIRCWMQSVFGCCTMMLFVQELPKFFHQPNPTPHH